MPQKMDKKASKNGQNLCPEKWTRFYILEVFMPWILDGIELLFMPRILDGKI